MAGDVHVIRWPDESHLLHALEATGAPRLVLVAPGVTAPLAGDCCQDWMWQTGTPTELVMRVQQISKRALAHGAARPALDRDGLLRVGLRSLPLPPRERALGALLVERFNQAVPAAELRSAGWPDSTVTKHALTTSIARLRRRIAPLGLEVVSVHGDGYFLCASSNNAEPAEPTFWEEVDTKAWLSQPTHH